MPKRDKQAVGQRFLNAFREAGAVEVAPDILLPADTLLDLYGEDIRARAYTSSDPLRGEMMLRPDFTVPVVQMHMAGGAEPARYCYLGEVFRKQDPGDERPANPRDNEYLQAGFELFAHDPQADAEVFALFHRLLAPWGLRAVTGDMGLVMDAVRALPLSEARRDALLHHVWRPKRFGRLLARFSRPAARRNVAQSAAPWAGLRTRAEMERRMARLAADQDAAPLDPAWIARLDRLFAISAAMPKALGELTDLSREWPDLAPAIRRIDDRAGMLADLGVAPETVLFDASHGHRTMEYYDGFTFSFLADGRTGWPPIATGGRYDALTAVLGRGGRAIPAVGGIIRPGLVAELETA
ncbi:ATP phosphoribosyltransferase regulatory subunit [Paracoccus sediminis]|uniref:ATP phosphoribosyltransferase regulatory subunit n=1 Tax=Paracoccus sediminis TaxID=1214787 RepID=A0ABY1YIH9_9RHOB|nr:ATP phosphoribosyltransferase regulatory subunit [Paracoccus sediminis]TBN49389.1 ATP phosphoribosyltransferase regulatory subunit [Paracoccus sediminis]